MKRKITILGQVPASKNNKSVGRNRYTGKTFVTSSKTVKEWNESALIQLSTLKNKIKNPILVTYVFYIKNKTRRDIDNMVATVNDILQKVGAEPNPNKRNSYIKGTGFIEDDSWDKLQIKGAYAILDKENPRVDIYIEEMNETFEDCIKDYVAKYL